MTDVLVVWTAKHYRKIDSDDHVGIQQAMRTPPNESDWDEYDVHLVPLGYTDPNQLTLENP